MLKPYDRPVDDRDDSSIEQPATSSHAAFSPMSKRPRKTKKQVTKLFVLDTNVLMHDPSSLFRFEEHDIYLPMGTLEELDSHKKGLSDVARNARQASRFLDHVVSHETGDIKAGLPIRTPEGAPTGGRLFLQTEAINGEVSDT